jgi:aryl-alcohol dehydrogenase-like predicted oxidoreductase
LSWYTEEDIAVAQEWFEWCREREIGMRHLNMRFVMACEEADCVLTGAANEDEVRTNAREAATPIPDDVWAEAAERIAALDDA